MALMTFAACASGGLARKDVLQQYEPIAQLNRGVNGLEAREGDLLAPAGMAGLRDSLDRAVEEARRARKDPALQIAGHGLGMLPRVRAHVDRARDEMQAVMGTRQRAEAAGAPGLFAERFTAADKELREASAMIERGNLDGARNRRPALMESYAGLELEALTRGAVEAAKAAIARAKAHDADDHAPALLKQAGEELALVSAVISADRTQIDKANEHARRAIWLAQRSEAVTALAKLFDHRKFDAEDMVLWHQDQLDYINEPLGQALPFNEPDRAVVESMRQSLVSLLKAQADSRAHVQSLTGQITALRTKVAEEREQLARKASGELNQAARRHQTEIAAREDSERRQQEVEERYRYVQSLFTESEAMVARQKDDVLIQAHGFAFVPGGWEPEARNFGLLTKIEGAIQRFPGSHVAVSGHTDSIGGTPFNLALSAKRSAGVAAFLVEVAGIPANHVTSEGLGEARPVATNESAAGRAQNRRIEIRIINTPVLKSSLP
jgi:outer membrane protein OmpA-like peptidoglycan-associated protein